MLSSETDQSIGHLDFFLWDNIGLCLQADEELRANIALQIADVTAEMSGQVIRRVQRIDQCRRGHMTDVAFHSKNVLIELHVNSKILEISLTVCVLLKKQVSSNYW